VELVYNEITTGAQNDIKHATELARNMVGAWGMSGVIGPVTVITEEGQLIAISSKHWRLRCWSARRSSRRRPTESAGQPA
jgi:ATP-dependent Zn protease